MGGTVKSLHKGGDLVRAKTAEGTSPPSGCHCKSLLSLPAPRIQSLHRGVRKFNSTLFMYIAPMTIKLALGASQK